MTELGLWPCVCTGGAELAALPSSIDTKTPEGGRGGRIILQITGGKQHLFHSHCSQKEKKPLFKLGHISQIH